MIKEIILCLIICGLLIPGIDSSPELVVVANLVDQELNTAFIDFLRQERNTLLVQPSEFEQYKFSSSIVILGGHNALEGTGNIVESVLTAHEKTHILNKGDVLIKLNVWHTQQVVVIIAGPDREKTSAVCEENRETVGSLFDGREKVLTIVEPDRDTIVFLHPSPISTTDTIAPYAESPLPKTELPSAAPYSIEENCWFFWIDDVPHAKFAHPTRFVFFGIETRTMTVHQEEWWPVLNGSSLWVESDAYWDSSSWVYNSGLNPPSSQTHSTLKAQRESADRGLVINGWSTGQPFKEDMIEDQKGMKETLIQLGMNVETVITVKEIRQVLQIWAGEMKSETLIVYVTAHGGRGFFLVGGSIFHVSELVLLLSDFVNSVHIQVIIDVSYSGSLIYPLQSVAETVIVSTSETTPAYGDVDFENDLNPSDKGSEFTSGLAASMKELARNAEKIEEWKKKATPSDTSWYIFLLAMAFETAIELDACAVAGHTDPQMWMDATVTEIILPQKGGSVHKGGCSCGG